MRLGWIFLKTEKGIHSVSNTLHKLSALVLFLLMILMSIDVVCRYILKNAITGSIDFVVLMMVVFIFLSLPNATLARAHVRTDILYLSLPKRVQTIFDVITIGLSAAITLLIAWQLGARALDIIQNPPGLATAYFSWPHYPFIMLAAVCCGLMFLELIIWVIQSIRQGWKG